MLATRALANRPTELDLVYVDSATATLGLAAAPEWWPTDAPCASSVAIHWARDIACARRTSPLHPRTGSWVTLTLDGRADGLPRRRMVSSHKDHKIRVFDVSEGRCIARMEGHPRTPFCIKVHPQRPNVLASACYDGCVKVWVWEGGEQNTEDRGEMVFRNPTFEQRVEGGAVSSINFVAGATIDDDAVIITCSGQVLWWRYGEPGAQAQPVNYSRKPVALLDP